MMRFTIEKEEKLKSKKLIEKLFAEGNRIKSFPLQLIYLPINHENDFPIKVGFSVPKRIINLAVTRNRVKRLMREVYRKNKYLFSANIKQQYIFMLMYASNKEIKYDDLEIALKKVCTKFLNKIQNEKN
jgi:ribonuclease P protein component